MTGDLSEHEDLLLRAKAGGIPKQVKAAAARGCHIASRAESAGENRAGADSCTDRELAVVAGSAHRADGSGEPSYPEQGREDGSGEPSYLESSVGRLSRAVRMHRTARTYLPRPPGLPARTAIRPTGERLPLARFYLG